MDINRALPIKSGFNFRELGGYKTKTGEAIKYQKILRSSGLFRLSNEDLSFLSDYGVKNVVDFRSPEEKRGEPDKPIAGSENIFNPVFSVDETMNSGGSQDMIEVLSEEGSGENQMLWVYQDIVTNPHSNQAYRNFFDTLLGNTEERTVMKAYEIQNKREKYLSLGYMSTKEKAGQLGISLTTLIKHTEKGTYDGEVVWANEKDLLFKP